MPLWLAHLLWKGRRKRAVVLHFKPTTGEERSIEGVLLGRWGGHYVLLKARVIWVEDGAPKAEELDGTLEVPAENVLAVQHVA
jgi:hypothetical protein